ncbi:YiiD C-terminal domain-containing protein [Sulfurivermis fontis]|uniref:YiiD C-terminal domain-containing protein n=1 Tax=Sulfurivermis fontis TaxID=1972068 RepID=UPI000FD89A9C|nr:YiiD C-terminal domain-containing protein [Sulfurivermis fontis]
MTTDELRESLYRDIPLSRAMQLAVRQADPACTVLAMPLAPNANHMNTVFGGSANTLAILATWSLLHLRLAADGKPCQIVIQHNTMHYLHPMPDAAEAVCRCDDDDAAWARFARTLARRGRARLTLHAEVHSAGRLCARFEGEFVAAHRPAAK